MRIDPEPIDSSYRILTDLAPLVAGASEEREPKTHGPTVLQIAAGVALGIIAAAIVIGAAVAWQQQQEAVETTRLLQQMNEGAQRQADALEAAVVAERERQQQRTADSTRAKADAQRSSYAAQMQAIAEQQRREEAWQQFYRPSARCANPTDDVAMECANAFIRAKRKFDADWSAGTL